MSASSVIGRARSVQRQAIRLSQTTSAPTSTLPGPQPGPQTAFLASSADIVIYGGAAGGGKTWSLLRELSRHRNRKGYRGVIFRRISRQIMAPNGLWDASAKLYPQMGGKSNATSLHWTFPGGGRVQFGHLQHKGDELGWQGSEIDALGFDELTHFGEEQFWYLLSRLRSLSGVKPYVRATTNPAPGWVRNLLAPWVMQGYDGPGGPAASGEVRRFVRREGEIVWLVGGEDLREGEVARTLTFIGSKIYDNQILMQSDPNYIGNLMALPTTERRRLLEGDWNVFDGAFFAEFEEHQHVVTPLWTPQEHKPAQFSHFGGLDWGYRAKFAFVLCAIDYEGRVHVLESVSKAKLTNEAQADMVRAVLARWGVKPDQCPIAADPSMWNQKTVNGVQGEADIEAFWRAGLKAGKADNNRQAGWSGIRRWLTLRIGKDQGPAVRVWRGYNADLLKMLPTAQFDEKDPEDMDEDVADGCGGHWDVLNALRYALRLRPAPKERPEPVKPKTPWQFATESDTPQEIR